LLNTCADPHFCAAAAALFAVSQSGLINQFPFDPAGMYSKDMAVKEVKNGRLAMVSAETAGCATEAIAAAAIATAAQHHRSIRAVIGGMVGAWLLCRK
jgi:hypothetical protein